MEKSFESTSPTYLIAAQAIDRIGQQERTRFTAKGLEHLADDGPQILAFSHHNSWDIPALGAVVYRHNERPIHFMAKEELLGLTAIGPFLKSMHGLPINRKSPQKSQIEGAIEVLKDGGIVGIAPEGGRQRSHEVPKLLGGVGFLATRASASVVPIGIAGQNLSPPVGPFLPRKIHLHFGEPLVPDTTARNRRELDERLHPALERAFFESYRGYLYQHGALEAAKLD